MNSLSFNQISTHSVQFLQERVFDLLTPQQKKAGVIALAVLSFLAVCFTAYYSCFRNKADVSAVPPSSPKLKSKVQLLDSAKYGITVLGKTRDNIKQMDATEKEKLAADILHCFPKDHFICIHLGYGSVGYYYLDDKGENVEVVATVPRIVEGNLTKEEEIQIDRLHKQYEQISLVDCNGQPVA